MKRLIAFALALAVVFGVSFALYKPERIEAVARETMDDSWSRPQSGSCSLRLEETRSGACSGGSG